MDVKLHFLLARYHADRFITLHVLASFLPELEFVEVAAMVLSDMQKSFYVIQFLSI